MGVSPRVEIETEGERPRVDSGRRRGDAMSSAKRVARLANPSVFFSSANRVSHPGSGIFGSSLSGSGLLRDGAGVVSGEDTPSVLSGGNVSSTLGSFW